MVTLKILAKELNISVSSVSKSLNDSYEISEDLKKKVKALAKKYNYKPNKVAQSLKSQKTMNIGVIIPNILNRFFAKALYGMELEATKLGYNIVTCLSNESQEKEKQSIELLINGSVDGFILAVSEETQVLKKYNHIAELQKIGVPLVMFDRVVDTIKCDKVVIDDFEAAKYAVTKLIDKKRKNIAFVTTIDNLKVGKKRRDAYKDTLRNHFGKVPKNLILNIDTNSDNQSQIKKFLLENPQIDAILSADNISGTMCINIAKDLGYKVPTDIAVIGFSDETISSLTVPKLSFINQDAQQIGSKAIELLISKLNLPRNTDRAASVKQIPFTFSEGESI